MKKYIFYLCAMFTLISCNDWLAVDSKSVLNDEDIAKYPELVESQFLSNYAKLQKVVQSIGDGRMTYRQHHLAIYTDDAASNTPWENAVAQNNSPGFVFGGIFSQSGGETFTPVWPYKAINEINQFIDTYRNTEDNQVKMLLGEAYFIRAFYFFEMAKRYGGVPLVASELKSDASINQRASEFDTWKFIETTLDSAIVNLPERQLVLSEDRDRANKYTALALKSRAMLYAGTIAKYGKVMNNGLQGIPQEKAQSFLTLAAQAAQSVVTASKYTLANNYGNLFNGKDEDNNEIIYRFSYNVKTGTQVFHDYWNQSYRIKKSGYTSFMVPTIDVVEGYEKLNGTIAELDYHAEEDDVANFFRGRDKRLDASIIYPGGRFLGETFQIYRKTEVKHRDGSITEYAYNSTSDMMAGATVPNYTGITLSGVDGVFLNNSGGGTTNYGFFLKKTLYGVSALEDYLSHENEQDAVILRYGEVILNLCEAAMELETFGEYQYSALAQTSFDALRERHGGLPSKTMTLANVRHERRVDLIYEGFRYWDLKRWRIGTQIHNTTKKVLSPILHIDETVSPARKYYTLEKSDAFELPTTKKWFEERDYYSPIPVNQSVGIVQNDGWI